uniref:Carbohydrate sulfotransferase n=1 Tax=Otus sunia TaxID=257818 RepID=A0A8C8BAX8_9STRI
MVMNLRQVFVSVLIFGVAGLLLFMYLQAWIEEQHTVTPTPPEMHVGWMSVRSLTPTVLLCRSTSVVPCYLMAYP